MNKEIKMITEAKQLMKWMSEHDVIFALTADDVELLLGYLEGHDYAIATDKNDDLVRIDLKETEFVSEEYSVDDLIDQVCEWNYELIEQTEERLEKADLHEDTKSLEESLVSYKKDEEKLDLMFEQTKYGKKIDEIARKTICVVVEKLELGVDEIAAVVADGVKHYRAETRR